MDKNWFNGVLIADGKIVLGIETSCDETAVCIIRGEMDAQKFPKIQILGNSLHSQIEMHAQYGGVFPTIAKREHSKNIVPLFESALKQAGIYKRNEIKNKNGELGSAEIESKSKTKSQTKSKTKIMLENEIRILLEREPEMAEALLRMTHEIEKPAIDLISVTQGPGLEPALWVGINFAKALSKIWNIPVIPANHMEGHILSVLIEAENLIESETIAKNVLPETADQKISFPAIALLISGGHTELVLIKNWHDYQIIGRTRDDAVGEAFDKVARILGLPYPGGPKISTLAEIERTTQKVANNNINKFGNNVGVKNVIKLPRPMINSDDYDFSFSGLKTAVLYLVKSLQNLQNSQNLQNLQADSRELTDSEKHEIAREFEDAVTDVLLKKTGNALVDNAAATLIIGGGVIANKHIRAEFEKMTAANSIKLLIPSIEHSTDNAVMIAVAGYMRAEGASLNLENNFSASGNLSL